MRGQDFIFDVYDYPEKAQEFLRLLTSSIIDFRRLTNRMNGAPDVRTHGTGLSGDFASLIAPDMWPDFVIPGRNQYY
ncbi:MAG TPA: hypothetical protein DDZ89_02725 [Clostridiales bacterium]|nr:hypothetical protein [Clostridiales bacterium]